MPDPAFHKTLLARLRLVVPTVIVITLVLVASCLVYHHELVAVLHDYLENRINPVFFILLMLIVPILGAPISVFLVLVGMKFGTLAGILLAAITMFFHLACTYYLVHSFLHRWLVGLLRFIHVPIPKTQVMPTKWHALVFVLIPGLPYVVKNNLLALTGLPFAYYLLIGWTAQFGLSIPFIIFGSAAMEMNFTVLSLALGLILAGYLLQRFIKIRYFQAKRDNDARTDHDW